ncbi:MAG: hypothetical protein Q8Q62_21650 [Mesorhizobium sp.]|nr:hypothetical protein [Mesorhizobium sp.]
MTDALTADHFTPHIGKSFRTPGWQHPLVLESVDVMAIPGSRSQDGFRQPFTLIFRGPPAEVLAEGFHEMESDGAGTFALYLIPVHTVPRDRQNYQAVFN